MSEEVKKGERNQPMGNEKEAEASHQDVYLYKASGIEERHGTIPLWLQLVAYGLIVWGIYYTIHYWSVG